MARSMLQRLVFLAPRIYGGFVVRACLATTPKLTEHTLGTIIDTVEVKLDSPSVISDEHILLDDAPFVGLELFVTGTQRGVISGSAAFARVGESFC